MSYSPVFDLTEVLKSPTCRFLGLIFTLVLLGGCRGARAPITLEIELRASAGTVSSVFWAEDYQFRAAQSAHASLRPDPARFQVVRFSLPPVPGPGIRFDPIETPGTVVIRRIDVLDADGRTIARVNPASMLPAENVASMRTMDDGTEIVTTSSGRPLLYLAVDALADRTARRAFTAVTPQSLTVATTAVLALLIACGWCVLAGVPPATDGTWFPGARVSVCLAGLVLLVFAARLLLIQRFPAPVPFYDQWDGEGYPLYIAFHEGWLSWPMMFMLHNEHRWFFSRLLSLDLLLLNRQWDPLLQQVVNALIHAATAGVTAAMIWQAMERRRLLFVVLVCAAVFAPPFAWENTLFGGSSQFYLLVLFTLLAFVLVIDERRGCLRWVLGWLCAACSLFTLAGGLLTAGCLVIAASIRAMLRPLSRRSVLDIAVGMALVVAGYVCSAGPLSHHAALRAGTPAEFAAAIGAALAWPWIGAPAWALWSWLPLGVALACVAHMRIRIPRALELAFLLGVWVVLQAAALAYGRGAHGVAPASRYMDLLSLSFLANSMAVAVLMNVTVARPHRLWIHLLCLAWVGVQCLGILALCRVELSQVTAVRQPWFRAHVQNVARFVFLDEDVAAFVRRHPPDEVPYPVPAMLANAWLRHPYIRSILPTAVREPLHLRVAQGRSGPFAANAFASGKAEGFRPGWGSFTAAGRAGVGSLASEPLGPCRLGGYVQFYVAGGTAAQRQQLLVKDLSSGVERPVRELEAAGEDWRRAISPCPAGQFSIVAHDLSSTSWLAFTEPVEAGTLSVLAAWVIAHAMLVSTLGVGALVVAAALSRRTAW